MVKCTINQFLHQNQSLLFRFNSEYNNSRNHFTLLSVVSNTNKINLT